MDACHKQTVAKRPCQSGVIEKKKSLKAYQAGVLECTDIIAKAKPWEYLVTQMQRTLDSEQVLKP